MKSIAIITGATGGVGQAFVQELEKEPLDEIWIVGRNEQSLLALKDKLGKKMVPICKDLGNRADLLSFSDLLNEQKPSVRWLVNNAGIARMAPSSEFSFDEIEQTIDLNCKAPLALIHFCTPYMEKGAKILNVSSASAFQPVPYINLYASTKAFERNYSRALHAEMASYGITVTAVCPSWVDTKMLTRDINGKEVHFPGIVAPEKVAVKAIKDAKKGQRYVHLLFLCKMPTCECKAIPPAIDHENLAARYQSVFVSMERNEIITERPNLFEPNVYITVCAEISGAVCPSRLTSAIRAAYCANEATMSKIVLRDGAAFYEKLPASGCKIEVTEQSWQEVVASNEKIPFALDKGELVRAFILPADSHTQIVLMAHHLVGDGKSIIYFVKDMMRALSGVPLTYKPLTLLTKKALSEAALTMPARFYANYCRRKWSGGPFTWQEYYDLHQSYWNTHSSDIHFKTLSIAETEQIIQNAKHIGCSVNSCLVTMFLQKCRSKCEVGIPVSIREHGNEAMSNLTSGIYISHQYDAGTTFEKNAMQVHRKIQKALRRNRLLVLKFLTELPPTLIDAVLLNTHRRYDSGFVKYTAKVMGYTEHSMRDLGITNLTVLDIPTVYGPYKIENIIFLPPAVSYSHHIYGVSTVNGKMTISYHNMIQI